MSPITSSAAEYTVTKSVARQMEDVADEVTEYATIVTTPSNQKVYKFLNLNKVPVGSGRDRRGLQL